MSYPCSIKKIYTSPEHNYFTRKKYDVGSAEDVEHESIILEAGLGLPHDRFREATYPVTFFSCEIAEAIYKHHNKPLDYRLFRRNIIISGINVEELIGEIFSIDGVVFEGMKHCNPCPWMNEVIGKGTYALMKGRGGLRALVKEGGELRLGVTHLHTQKPLVKGPLEALKISKIPF